MYHFKIPDQTGYYFIGYEGRADDWDIVYWDCECKEPMLLYFTPDVCRLGFGSGISKWVLDESVAPHRWRDVDCDGSWSGPEVWFGPIGNPGGEFGNTTVIPEFEIYQQARAEGKSLKVSHVDNTSQDRRLGTVTEICIVDDSKEPTP